MTAFTKLKDRLEEIIRGNPTVAGVYVITGANSGIGYAVAEALLARKRPVFLVDKTTGNLAKFGQDCVLEADLTDEHGRAKIAQRLSEVPIRCLMNIAGIGFKGDFFDSSADSISKTLAVNIGATLQLTHALKRKLVTDRSDIVNVASSVAYYPLPGMAVYAASKAFVASWSEALAIELKQTNRVFTVSPGGTKTNFQRAAGVKESSDLLSPTEVSRRLLHTLEGRPRTAIYGMRAKFLAIFGRVLPQRRVASLMGHLFSGSR